MALVKGHSVTCKRDHEVGYLDNDELYLFTLPQKSSIDKCRYIEPSSSVVVVIPGEGAPKEWSSTVNFLLVSLCFLTLISRFGKIHFRH